MKKKINGLLLCCLFFIGIHPLHAQLTLGLKGGYTKAWEHYGDVILPDNAEIDVDGFNVSALGYVDIGKQFKLGAAPGFVRRGAACLPGFGIFSADSKFFLSYVELPIFVSRSIPIYKDKVSLLPKIGYGTSFMTKAVMESPDLQGIIERQKLELNNSARFNRWETGFYGGCGLAFSVKEHQQILVETEYYYSMRDAEKWNTSKNRSLSFSAGYLINL